MACKPCQRVRRFVPRVIRERLERIERERLARKAGPRINVKFTVDVAEQTQEQIAATAEKIATSARKGLDREDMQ